MLNLNLIIINEQKEKKVEKKENVESYKYYISIIY